MARNQNRFTKVPLNRGNQERVAALSNKLTRDQQTARNGSQKSSGGIDLSRDMFERISQSAGQERVDADGIFQLLPDIELAQRIMVGSILSPKDMCSAEVLFNLSENEFSGEVARPLLQVVEDHFRDSYKIDGRLTDMLEKTLFRDGAYPLLILPENSLDVMINGSSSHVSNEAFQRALKQTSMGQAMGFLGPVNDQGEKVSLEDYSRSGTHSTKSVYGRINPKASRSFNLNISVEDNFNILKRSAINQSYRRQRISDILKRNRQQVSNEARKGLTAEQIEQLYGQNAGTSEKQRVQNVVPSSYLNRPSKGHPLVMKLPVESVIPVHVPGQPEEHVGYFLMIDERGRFVQQGETEDYYGTIRTSFQKNGQNQQSDLIRQTRDAVNGFKNFGDATSADVESLQNAFDGIVENNLLNRLANGLYDEDLELGFTENVQRIMLQRSLKNQHTQLLYVPVELLVYMAFDYDENGIGQSLLARSKILSSMRSVLMFADTMAAVRNAVGRKKVNVKIDGADPDPQKTIGEIQELVMEKASRGFPIGAPNPDQTMSYLQRAGFDFKIDVDGENYPTTSVDFDDYTTSTTAGNTELQDRLRRMQISGFGMNPDLVDPTASPDFAVSVVNNNLMMTRMVIEYQKLFTMFLSTFIQTYTYHSSVLMEDLKEVLQKHKTKLTKEQKRMNEDELLEFIIANIRASLPAPDTTRLDQQQQAFNAYSQFLDEALGAYITTDLFPPELLAQDPEVINTVVTSTRAYFLRRWLQNNNMLPELDELTEMDGDEPTFNLMEIQKGQYESLGKAIIEYAQSIVELKKNYQETYGESEDNSSADGDYGDSSGGDDDEAGFNNDTDELESDEDEAGFNDDVDELESDEDDTDDNEEEDDEEGSEDDDDNDDDDAKS